MKISRHYWSTDIDATWTRLAGDAFFATPRWARLWKAKGGRPLVWLAEADGRPAAILPGVEFDRGPLCRFMSMPDGCYGGVFVDPDLGADADRFRRALLDALVGAGYFRAHVFDFDGHLGEDGRFSVVDLETTLVDISSGDWEPADPKLVAQVRCAQRRGIEVMDFDWERHHREFLGLMRGAEARHGRRPFYPDGFFHELAALVREDSDARWVWCEHEGRGACSHIYVVERGMLQGWQVYFDKAFSFLKPNQYIRVRICREMSERGIGILNLGGSPENAPGLEYYKKRWGGRTCAYRGLVRRRWPRLPW